MSRKERPALQIGPLHDTEKVSRPSLIAGFTDIAPSALDDLPIGDIQPRASQPRRFFHPAGLEQLATSIRQHGILQPLSVHERGGVYELIAGERRLRAAKLAGLSFVPVKVFKGLTEAQIGQFAAMENLQREDLNPVDEADALLDILSAELAVPREQLTPNLERWKSLKMKDPALAKATPEERESIEKLERVFGGLSKGVWTSFVSNRLPVLRLPEDLLEAVRSGAVEYTKATALRRLAPELRAALLPRAASLSLQELRREIAQATAAPGGKAARPDLLKELGSPASRRKLERLPDAAQWRVMELLQEVKQLLDEAPAEGEKAGKLGQVDLKF